MATTRIIPALRYNENVTISYTNRISIIIVNINGKEILSRCLDNLKDVYPNLEVIVVDNGSIDGAADMVSENYSWVTLIRSGNNGLAAGINLGRAQASGDYLLYLGSDSFPEKGKTLEGLVEYMEMHPDVGAATVKLLTRDGKIDMDCHRGIPTPWVSLTHFLRLDKLFPHSNLFAGYYMTYLDLETAHQIGATITHFLFVRKSASDAIGRWDESFFVYGEDIDYCYRIAQAGIKLVYIGYLKAEHWKGVLVGRKETSDKISTKGTVIVRGRELTKPEFYTFCKKCQGDAMRIFFKKHLAARYPPVLRWLVLIAISAQGTIRLLGLKYFLLKKSREEASRIKI